MSLRSGTFPTTRLRRLRYNPAVRELVKETQLSVNDLILPLFIKEGLDRKKPISSMPGHFQLGINDLEEEITELQKLGLNQVLLFGIPAHKDGVGSDSYNDQGIIQKAIIKIKTLAPQMLVITDVCFCEYTDHGHCGLVEKCGDDFDVNNDKTLDLLVKQAVSHAKAGADVIAPSGNMDGMVQAIRRGLDNAGFDRLPILSYAVKYASSMYGPFREAAEGAPKFGDRRSYQMDPANGNEALAECALDVSEGADMLMVKPAHTYLDIIRRVKEQHPDLPLGAYHVSGEYCMLKAAVEKGWLDEKRAALEVLTSIRRAGADFIFTYYAKEAAKWLSQ